MGIPAETVTEILHERDDIWKLRTINATVAAFALGCIFVASINLFVAKPVSPLEARLARIEERCDKILLLRQRYIQVYEPSQAATGRLDTMITPGYAVGPLMGASLSTTSTPYSATRHVHGTIRLLVGSSVMTQTVTCTAVEW